MKLKIVFVGGLTNGKIVYDYLKKNKYVDLVLAFTYPASHQGPRSSVIEDGDTVIKTNSINSYLDKIKGAEPDYIFVAGWSELISDEIIAIAKKGTIGFHPSKLPMDRGRSVLAWQIEDGYTESALSMFYYSDFPDGGDIIGQEMFTIERNDYINDVLNKVDSATVSLLKAYFPLLRQGKAPRIPQSIAEGNFRRLRGRADSCIEWDQNTIRIYNKIRAIAPPYPCAVGRVEEEDLIIYTAEILNDFPFGKDNKPGTLVARLYDQSLVIKTRDGFIRLIKYGKE